MKFQGFQWLTLFLVIFRNFPTAVNLHTILYIFYPLITLLTNLLYYYSLKTELTWNGS
jgi:hypothetical protein